LTGVDHCPASTTNGERGGSAVPYVSTNGIRLAYERAGQGKRVLLIMGSRAGSNMWSSYQTPALNRAGYQTIIFDNRGIPPSDVPAGIYSLADMVADTEGLIEALEAGPCRVVGSSMGAMIAEELAARRPDLVECAVLIATRSRSDVIRLALTTADRALDASGVQVPRVHQAASSMLQMLSPATLNDDAAASAWLELFEMAGRRDARAAGQAGVDFDSDRRDRLRQITVPCRVIAFTDDLTCPPHLAAEVAAAIPDCDFVQIDSCGHLGHLERPDQVNAAMIEFLDKN
jgi:pimeloyl-ACP methyl ester carboxylesterase